MSVKNNSTPSKNQNFSDHAAHLFGQLGGNTIAFWFFFFQRYIAFLLTLSKDGSRAAEPNGQLWKSQGALDISSKGVLKNNANKQRK
jgi:hypothetical protein